MPKTVKRLYKTFGLTAAIALSSWTCYESYMAVKTLRRPLNLNVLSHRKCEFIYIQHDYFRQPVQDFLNELFKEETKIYAFLYNLRRKLTFTKLEYALKTLRVAKHTKDPFLRRKAIRNLSNDKFLDLDNWEYQFLSQYVDSTTAVSLVRSGCNVNLIPRLKELPHKKSKLDIIDDVKAMLKSMEKSTCVKFILQTTSAFQNIKDDHDSSLHELHHENDHILQSLDHFLHLTTKPEFCMNIVELGGLEILKDILRSFQNNIDIKLIINKIITNMSSVQGTSIIDHLFKSGWISLLSQWQQEDDLRIQVLSSTALHNLDKFDASNFIYQPKLYPLYPRGDLYLKSPELDIIFVHGLLGGIWITWRVQRESDMTQPISDATDTGKHDDENLQNSFIQEEAIFRAEKIIQMEPGPESKILTFTKQTTKNVLAALHELAEDNLSVEDLKLTRRILTHIIKKLNDTNYSFCWPIDWLPPRFPNIRIIGLQFESSLSYWNSLVCPCEADKLHLKARSTDYLKRLADAGIGSNGRPVVWVSHSMGGLIVKHIINEAFESSDAKVKQIGENSRGIVFLGVPHRGSVIAKVSQQTSALLWPTIEVKDLQENSKELQQLNEQFLNNIAKMQSPCEIVSIAEGQPTKIFQNIKLNIVPMESAYLGVGDFYVSQENHLNLSKPLSQNSFIFLTVVNMIEKILAEKSKSL